GRVPDVRSALWGADDDIVLMAGLPSRWWRIRGAGGEPQALRFEWEPEALFPQHLLPRGNEVLASSRNADGDFLEIVSLETGARRRLLSARAGSHGARVLPSGHLVYSEGGALFAARFDPRHLELRGSPVPVLDGVQTASEWFGYFALSDAGTLVYVPAQDPRPSRLLWVDRSGRADPVPGGEAPFFGSPRLSPDGTRVATTLDDARSRQIWIFDLVRGTRTRLTSEGDNRFPVWGPDGTSLVFQRNVRARDGIFRQPVDGSAEATMVLERKDRPHPCAFTPDGRGLVFMDASPGPRAEALIHTADGGLSV